MDAVHKWLVWVGGVTVTDSPTDIMEANTIAREYMRQGYDDVVVQQVEADEIVIH